jgi:hypothetical protein
MADQSKIGFGLSQIGNPTPESANWIFRGYFIISKAFIGWMGYTKLIPQADIYEILGVTSLLLDPIMLGFSKLFGIVPEAVDPSKPFLANQQVNAEGNVNAIPDTVLKPQSPAV